MKSLKDYFPHKITLQKVRYKDCIISLLVISDYIKGGNYLIKEERLEKIYQSMKKGKIIK